MIIDTVVHSWPRKWRGVVESRFYLRSTNLLSVSSFTGQRTPYGPNSQIWIAELTFPKKRADDWREMSAFISQLDGINGLLSLTDYFRMRPNFDRHAKVKVEGFSDDTLFTDETGFETGVLPANVVIAESAALGAKSVVVKGFKPSVPKTMTPGDLFQILPNGIATKHGHLYEVLNPGNTDSDGWTRLNIRPSLRAGVMAGDQVRLRAPSSVFRLADDGQGIVNRSLGNLGSMGLIAVEELPQQ